MKSLLLLFLLCATTCSGKPTGDLAPESLQMEERCQCNLFNEAVQLLSTHTVERLEQEVIVKENALKEKENEVESLMLELEKKQEEMEKSWTLVSYMMKVMSSSKEMMKSKEELVVAQAARIEEMEKQVADFSQTVRMINTSQSVIEAQEKTIDELRKIVTEDSKLTETYRELKEVNLLKTNCDVTPYLTIMADSLNSQHEEISELKAVLQEEDRVNILLSNITTEMESLNEAIQATGENVEVLGKCQQLSREQSSGLNILRSLVSHAVSRNNSLPYAEIEAQHPSTSSPLSPTPASTCPPAASTTTTTTTTTTITTTTTPLSPGPVKVLVRKEVGNPADYFDKTFAEYKEGFSANGESWLGLDNLHSLTSQRDYKLKITMTDFDGKKYHAVYDRFKVGQGDDYLLTVGGFNDALSTLGDSMIVYSGYAGNLNGMKFSTKDQEQGNCAKRNTGGWWYNSCTIAHLTGLQTNARSIMDEKQISYYSGGERGDSWDSWSEAEMLLLPN